MHNYYRQFIFVPSKSFFATLLFILKFNLLIFLLLSLKLNHLVNNQSLNPFNYIVRRLILFFNSFSDKLKRIIFLVINNINNKILWRNQELDYVLTNIWMNNIRFYWKWQPIHLKTFKKRFLILNNLLICRVIK